MKIRDGFNFGIGLFLSSILIFAIGLFLVLTVYLIVANANGYNSSNHDSIYDQYKRSE